jgi:hypothetical protein
MADSKTARDQKKRAINERLQQALDTVNTAATPDEIENGISDAQEAEGEAESMTQEASNRAIAKNHTDEDLNVEAELRDFLTSVQDAVADVMKVGEKRKSELKATARPAESYAKEAKAPKGAHKKAKGADKKAKGGKKEEEELGGHL